MKYYIIAGEASGDLHASNLMKSILKQDKKAVFRFFGGDLMTEVYPNGSVKHYRDLAFMGFLEVLLNLKTILKNIRFCKRDILRFSPDAIILVDYPGFNMRIARWAKQKGYRTHYYISPQVWAWKENRVNAIKRDVDAMYVILPFEKPFYEERHDYPVYFVGHPLLDAIHNREPLDRTVFYKTHNLEQKPIIALLPGSRKQEIYKMLSEMARVTPHFENYQFVVAGAPSLDFEFYKPILSRYNLKFVSNKTYDLLSIATAALVTSGTATLETALFKVPEVVCYKGSKISYFIAKNIITLKYISLVNLILDKECVRELIQRNMNTTNLVKALKEILSESHRIRLRKDYTKLKQLLGGIGAGDKVAKLIVKSLEKP